MKLTRTWLSVVTVAVAVIATACGGSTGTTTNPADQTGTLTVWLMNGSAPQSVIDSVNADFNAKYPKVTVKVEIQQWGDIGTKLDTAFGGSNPPDVIELGNTLVAKYAAADALENISGKKSSFDNSNTWLQSLVRLPRLVDPRSHAEKTGDEAKQDAALPQGHIAMVIANGWEVGVITDPKAGTPAHTDKLGASAMPSHKSAQTAPVFLGG